MDFEIQGINVGARSDWEPGFNASEIVNHRELQNAVFETKTNAR